MVKEEFKISQLSIKMAPLTPEERITCKVLRDQGRKITDIAREVGCSR